ncbi:MAG: hypothetical protein M3N11_02920 [Actinomycetota bacterium]|nr:hypothetical protein [Actinomycetota bacterium]
MRLILTTGDNIYLRSDNTPEATGDEDDDWFFTFYQPYRYILDHVPVYRSVGTTTPATTSGRTIDPSSPTTSSSQRFREGAGLERSSLDPSHKQASTLGPVRVDIRTNLARSKASRRSSDGGDHQADRLGGREQRPISGDEDEVRLDHLQGGSEVDSVVGAERLRLGQVSGLADEAVVHVDEVELDEETLQFLRRRPEALRRDAGGAGSSCERSTGFDPHQRKLTRRSAPSHMSPAAIVPCSWTSSGTMAEASK